MKRLTFALLAFLFVLAACSQPEPVDVSGAWTGQLDNAGTVSFTVDDENQIDPYDFFVTYEADTFDFEVSSSVRGDRFTFDAVARTLDTTGRLNVVATVEGNGMTGKYTLSYEGPDGTVSVTGTFTAHR